MPIVNGSPSEIPRRIALLADEAPTAEAAARVFLAHLCDCAGWKAARMELRGAPGQRGVWHLRPGQAIGELRGVAEERRGLAAFMGGEQCWKTVMHPSGSVSFLFPVRAGERIVGGVEAFGEDAPEDSAVLELTLAVCAEAGPLLARKPAEANLVPLGLADPLTGLASRVLFMQHLATAVERARRSRNTAVA